MSHPYAYFDGHFCCAHSKEKVSNQGYICDSGEISLTSRCCKDNAYVKCPSGLCLNNAKTGKSTTWDSFCPRSHPYVYQKGGYCCAHNREKNIKGGPDCDGGLIDFSSTCCLNDNFVKCGPGSGKMCSTHWSLAASAEASLMFATSACISTTNGQLTKANVDLIKIINQIFQSMVKDRRAVDSLFGKRFYAGGAKFAASTYKHSIDEVIELYVPAIKIVLLSVELHIKSKAKSIFDDFLHSLKTIIGGAGDIDFDKSRAKVEATINEAASNSMLSYVNMIKKVIKDAFYQMEVIDSSTSKIKDQAKLMLALDSAIALVQEATDETHHPTNDETIVKRLKNFCSWIIEDYKEIKDTFGEIRAIREKSK